MTVLESAQKVLTDAKEPLHYREITDRILAAGIWSTEGSTPWFTLNAALAMDIKRKGKASAFVRVAPGTYTLNRNQSDEQAHPPHTTAQPRNFAGTSDVPPFQEYMNPTLSALRDLGGSASNAELEDAVTSRMGLTDDQLAIMHGEGSNQTEVGYRMAWARTYLKKVDLVESSARGVWALTPKGVDTDKVDAQEIVRVVRSGYRDHSPADIPSPEDTLADDADAPEDEWKKELQQTLLDLTPDAFERLAQRLLRESGFVEVKVTGRSGDGGIDGMGLLRLQGVVSFHVIFQCKRYQGTVGSREIRDFRGAMVGRTDKGIFITTGTFTKEAKREATRDGAPPIDLVDGDTLVELLRSLNLGVRTEVVERVVVEPEWFEAL